MINKPLMPVVYYLQQRATAMSSEYTPAIRQARELSQREGYDVHVWMLVLNRQAGADPNRLRRAAAILTGLTEDSPMTN